MAKKKKKAAKKKTAKKKTAKKKRKQQYVAAREVASKFPKDREQKIAATAKTQAAFSSCGTEGFKPRRNLPFFCALGGFKNFPLTNKRVK